MKILHIIYSLMTGGAETMLVDIANEQAKRGHDVEILIVNNRVDPAVIAGIAPAVTVHRFNRREGSNPLWLMARLNMFVLRRRPDIVHLHDHNLNALLRVKRSATLYTVHALNLPVAYARRNPLAAISEAVRDDLEARVPGATIRTIPNGIHTEAIARRHEGAMPGKTFRIVQVGRLDSETKGQDILIKALAELTNRGHRASVCFMGGGADEPFLRQLARDEGVADLVEFRGNMARTEIYASLKDFDAMCHPSRFEGFGLTIAEGMAAGLPVIVPEHGGPWEVAGQGTLCESFTSGNPAACADALERVIGNYPAALTRAQAAIAHIRTHYSIAATAASYLDYYRALLALKTH